MNTEIDVDKQRAMYASALNCQDASNLQGLLLSLVDFLPVIRQEAAIEGNSSTDWINRHPVIRMFMEQMFHLCNGHAEESLDWAREECEKRAKDGYLQIREYRLEVTVKTAMDFEEVKDRVHTFANDAFLAKEYFGKPSIPAEGIHVVTETVRPKPKGLRDCVLALVGKELRDRTCITDLRLVWKDGTTTLQRKLAAHDLLLAVLQDNEETPGGPFKGAIYVQEDQCGDFWVRFEGTNQNDMDVAEILCGFEEDNYLVD